MANINLLPWREELREERKREFLIALGVVIAIAAGILFLGDRYINTTINNQERLNTFLEEQNIALDNRLAGIREIREQKTLLTERMGVIQDLEGTRPIIVRLFDELVRTLPEKVYYNSITKVGDDIRLEGNAEAYSLVSTLMRQLDASDWFSNAVLMNITAGSGDDGETFLLNVKITTPEVEQEL